MEKDIERLAQHGEWHMEFVANQLIMDINHALKKDLKGPFRMSIAYWRSHKDRMKKMGLEIERYDEKISELTKNLSYISIH